MKTRTLTNLTADVRLYSGLGTSQAVTDAQIMRLLNESITALALVLANQPEQRHIAKSGTASYSGGTLALPVDCWRLDRLAWVLPTGQENPIRMAASDELEAVNTDQVDWTLTNPYFYWDANGIAIYPYPAYTETVKFYYQPYLIGCYNNAGTAIQELTTGTDYIDCRMGSDIWIVYDSSIKAKAAQEIDFKDLAFLRANLETELRKTIKTRATETPKRLSQSKYRSMQYVR